jgi:hypothetical protein
MGVEVAGGIVRGDRLKGSVFGIEETGKGVQCNAM